jgi:hypothetical protein
MHDVYLYTYDERRQSRCEFTTSLVFNTRSNRFRIRISQDYDTQAKIEHSYLEADEADAYLAQHPEHRDRARRAIDNHIAEHPEHEKAMKAAMALMKNL